MLAGLITAGTFAAPLAANADAAVVRLKVASSSTQLTHVPSIGFANMQFPANTVPDHQRWDRIDGPGPAVYYRNVANKQCLRAHPTNNIFVRTRVCDFSGTSTASKEQQWIHGGDGRLVNRDRFERGIAASALTVDFANVNRIVNLAPFSNLANQKWTHLAG
jgi:hypothetical protein